MTQPFASLLEGKLKLKRVLQDKTGNLFNTLNKFLDGDLTISSQFQNRTSGDKTESRAGGQTETPV